MRRIHKVPCLTASFQIQNLSTNPSVLNVLNLSRRHRNTGDFSFWCTYALAKKAYISATFTFHDDCWPNEDKTVALESSAQSGEHTMSTWRWRCGQQHHLMEPRRKGWFDRGDVSKENGENGQQCCQDKGSPFAIPLTFPLAIPLTAPHAVPTECSDPYTSF